MNPLNINGEEYVTKVELSQRLKVGVRTVDRWMREGKVPPHKFSMKVVRFKWSEVQRALEEKELGAGSREQGAQIANYRSQNKNK